MADLSREPWSAFQSGIYRLGAESGVVPRLPTNLVELESLATRQLSDEARGYIVASAGDGSTARANRDALDRWRVVPRILRGAEIRSTGTQILGQDLPAPLLIAPVGVQTLAHELGECATARAAESFGVPYVHSQASSFSYEDVVAAAPTGPKWLQFYSVTDDDVCVSLLRRAQKAGFTHLVVTVDTTLLGWRPTDLDRAYLPFLRGIGIANYTSDLVFMSRIPAHRRNDPSAVAEEWLRIFPHPGLTWDRLSFLRAHWVGPILIKGVSHPDDARRAIDEGVDGVIVSNHGGRQIDGAIGAADCLASVVDVAAGHVAVLFDSGIRTGVDVYRALALGADAVLIGRAFLYGLALDGQRGVEHVLACMLAELDLTLALSGHQSHHSLDRTSVASSAVGYGGAM